MHSHASLSALRDDVLLRRFEALVHKDNAHLADLLRHIDEIDRRRLWAEAGYPSMFAFCVGRFHMSESMAGKRIGVARVARRYPVVFDMVQKGELHLSGIMCLKAHLTDDNHARVLAEAKHKTREEIQLLVAHVAPKPDVPSRIRPLPHTAPATAPAQSALELTPAPDAEPASPPDPSPPQPQQPPPQPPTRAPNPKPLAPRRYALQITMGEQGNQNLRALQGLLAHQIPNGDPAAIVERALAVLVEHTLKQKAALTEKPRPRPQTEPEPTTARSRAIPAHVRRAVWQRDEGRCAFVAEDGTRCNSTWRIEYAHIDPYAKGGEHTVDNVALRCDGHNDYEAVRDYGELFMSIKRGERDHTRERLALYQAAHRAPTARALHSPRGL